MGKRSSIGRRNITLAIIVGFGSAAASGGAKTPPAVAQAPIRALEIVPIAYVGGPVTSIVRHGEYAYAVAGRTLIVFDIADPKAPRAVGESIDLPQGSTLVAAGYGLLVLKADPSRLIDVSDPLRPVLLAGELPIGSARSVAIRAGLIYAADRGAGLRVIDADDPSDPREIATLAIGGDARDLGLAERRLIMTRVANRADPTSTNALLVVNISDPYAPRIASELKLSAETDGLAVDGTRALIDGGRGGYGTVIAIDLLDEDRPRVVGEVQVRWPVEPLSINGDVAWGWNPIPAPRGTAGLTRIRLGSWPDIEIADPDHVVYGARRSMIGLGDIALVADGYHGLGVIGTDVADSLPFPVLGSGGRPVIDGDRLWIADDDRELWAADIAEPRSTVLRGTVDLETGWSSDSSGIDLAMLDGFLIATTPYLFSPYGVLDVIDPGPMFEPRHAGAWLPSESVALEESIIQGDPPVIYGDRAYVASNGTGMLHEFDLGEPSSARLARSFDPGAARKHVAVAIVGDHAWLSIAVTGISVIDLAAADGTLREVTRYVEPGHAMDIASANDHVFVADGPYGLRAIDASDPRAPRTAGRVRGFDAVSVRVHGDQAWVGVDEGEDWATWVFDISEPEDPVTIGRYPRNLRDVAVADGFAYAPAVDGGLEVFELREGGVIERPWAQVWLPLVLKLH